MHTRKQLGSKGIIFELSLEGIPLYEEIYLASNIPPLESRDPPSLEKVPGEGSLVALEESGGRHFRDAFYKGTKRETFFHKRRRNAIRPVPLSLFAPFARIGGPIPFSREYFTPELSTSSLWSICFSNYIYIFDRPFCIFRSSSCTREISFSGEYEIFELIISGEEILNFSFSSFVNINASFENFIRSQGNFQYVSNNRVINVI